MALQADTIPRYAPPTPAELDALFGDMTTLCDTCRHRGVLRREATTPAGFRRKVVTELCCAAMMRGESDELWRIDGPVDACDDWEVWDE